MHKDVGNTGYILFNIAKVTFLYQNYGKSNATIFSRHQFEQGFLEQPIQWNRVFNGGYITVDDARLIKILEKRWNSARDEAMKQMEQKKIEETTNE